MAEAGALGERPRSAVGGPGASAAVPLDEVGERRGDRVLTFQGREGSGCYRRPLVALCSWVVHVKRDLRERHHNFELQLERYKWT